MKSGKLVNEFRFLGTMAGKQELTYSSALNAKTYTRIYKELGLSNDLRKDIHGQEDKDGQGEGFKKIGEMYSYTMDHLKEDDYDFGDDRSDLAGCKELQGGGFFITKKKFTEHKDIQLNNFEYALCFSQLQN